MKEKIVINPLKGLSDIKFGSTKNDVEKLFGKPEDTEVIEVEEEDLSDAIVWNYDELGFSAFFEKDFDELLTCFDISNDEADLFGQKVFTLAKEKIIELMKNNGFSDFESDDEEWGEHRLSFNDAVMDFYFDENELVSISWGVMIDEDNAVQWP